MAMSDPSPIRWDELEAGRKYLVHHQSPEQRKMRESVLVFLGVEPSLRGGAQVLTSWSARPVAGTQNMPGDWVHALYAIDQRVECRVNEFPAGERLA